MNRTALITGASSGIGAVYADRLAARGHDLILVARRADRLSDLAAQLERDFDISVEIVPADLSTDVGIETVERRIKQGGDMDVLVNNAGIPAGVPVADASPDRVDAIIAVNVRAVARLAGAAAGVMKRRGTGTIVNIASVMGLMHEAGRGLYGPTKAFVIALSQNLQAEFSATNVYVQAVLPAATRTDIWEAAGLNPDEIDGMMEVGDLVDAAMSGFDKREAITIPSLPQAELWETYDAQRRVIVANVSHEVPAARYRHEDA